MAIRSLDQQLLHAVRMGADAAGSVVELATVPVEELRETLADESTRRAFWINVYNAFALLALRKQHVDLRDRKVRMQHYGAKRFVVAGEPVSLNTIEHGLLRGGRLWWSFGYLRDPFPSAFEKALRVPLDPRIHFALNCGALSCPPIAYYDAARLDEQLELATSSFLEDSTTVDPTGNTVTVSALFSWYRADFDGPQGTLALLDRHGIIAPGTKPAIRFAPYDWSQPVLQPIA